MMAHEGPASAGTPSRLLQSLPQELYDRIYDLTFTAVAEDNIRMTKHFRFPAVLHVDHASRELAAAAYYSQNKVFTGTLLHGFFFAWLHAIPSSHRGHIRDIRYDQGDPLQPGRLSLLYAVLKLRIDLDPLVFDPSRTLYWSETTKETPASGSRSSGSFLHWAFNRERMAYPHPKSSEPPTDDHQEASSGGAPRAIDCGAASSTLRPGQSSKDYKGPAKKRLTESVGQRKSKLDRSRHSGGER